MTRYAADHKAKTRARLLEAARHEFREHGFERASIDRLMSAAGLTRGGFYAHFASKEALVREVLQLEAGLLRQLKQVPTDGTGRPHATELLEAYLAPDSRDSLIQCPLVAHPIDAIRGGDERRALYGEQVAGMVEALREILGEDEAEEAILLTVLAVGAAVLSSAVSDSDDADRIQAVCQSEIKRRLAE